MKKIPLFWILYCVLSIGTIFAYSNNDLLNAQYLANNSIIKIQKIPVLYRMDDFILRQEVIGMALKIKGITLPKNYSCKNYFIDATADDWVCRAMELAADNNIISRANTRARPMDRVTRAEALAILLKTGKVSLSDPRRVVQTDGAVWSLFEDLKSLGFTQWQSDMLDSLPGCSLINHGDSCEDGATTNQVFSRFQPNVFTLRLSVFEFAALISGFMSVEDGEFIVDDLMHSAWLTRNSQGLIIVDSHSSQGITTFGYERSNEIINTGFPLGHRLPDVTNQIFYNLSLDGYGGLPPGSCLHRGYLLSDNDPTKATCTTNENQDLLRLWWSETELMKNVLIKNTEIKNAFRTYNYVDGVVVPTSVDIPHTDTFQSYFGARLVDRVQPEPEWLAIQDSVIKNSDNGIMIVGDTWWKGFLYQNLDAGLCEDWFQQDVSERIDNDYAQFGGGPGQYKYPCGNAMLADSYYYAPTWLVNVETHGQAVRIGTNGGAPVIIIGANKDTLSILYDRPTQTNPICRYSYLEDAINDTDVSDGCGNFTRPPFLELSCSGWEKAPEGCEARLGYLGTTITPFSGIKI